MYNVYENPWKFRLTVFDCNSVSDGKLGNKLFFMNAFYKHQLAWFELLVAITYAYNSTSKIGLTFLNNNVSVYFTRILVAL